MIAASAGREEIVRILISHGAYIDASNSSGQSPLHYAASKDRPGVIETKYLFKQKSPLSWKVWNVYFFFFK